MDQEIEEIIHGMDPEKVFAIGVRSGLKQAIKIVEAHKCATVREGCSSCAVVIADAIKGAIE